MRLSFGADFTFALLSSIIDLHGSIMAVVARVQNMTPLLLKACDLNTSSVFLFLGK